MPADQADETALIALARGGNARAFEALYHAHAARVHALCLRMAGQRSLAEDLTQEAFVLAWRALPAFRGASRFGTWLHRIAVNAVLAHLRSRDDWRFDTEADAEAIAAEPAPVGRGALIDLERAIAALPPGARGVFVLHDIEGFEHAEIAGLLGIAEGTSKAHLHRARRLLARRLE